MIYTGALSHGGSLYGVGVGPVHMVNVECTGSETSLTSCRHGLFGEVSSNCRTHLEDAGVVCSSGSLICHSR